MATNTTLLGLGKADGTDNARSYLKTTLAAALDTLDEAVLANATGTHISASKAFDVAQDHKQVTTPASNPAAGYDRLYFKNDDFLYRITSAGVEAVIGNGISNGGSVASAATLALPTVPAGTPLVFLTITGVSAVTTLTNVPANGTLVLITFGGVLTFTNGNNIKLNASKGNFATAGNAWLALISDGTNLWELARSAPGSSTAPLTASLGADVALNNSASTFDGPSLAQGTLGKWWVAGSLTLNPAAASNFAIKLWDGTTVIDSLACVPGASTGTEIVVSLAGFLATPAGNLRISVQDSGATTALIKFNASGNSKDSTISAFRIDV